MADVSSISAVADDVLLISQGVGELQKMLKELKVTSGKRGLIMNLSKKTKIMPTGGKENETAEFNRRVDTHYQLYVNYHILKDKNISNNFKRKLFNTCLLPFTT